MPQDLDGKYSIEIFSPTGQLIADLSGRATNRTIHMIRNGSYGAEWKIDLDTLEKYARATNTDATTIFAEGQNEAVIKRSGVPIIGGQIEYTQGDLGDTKDVSVRIVGWYDLFASRQTSIERLFTAGTDIGSIAWTLIQESQALTFGSYGITEGDLQPSATIAVDTLFEFKNIKEALAELSARIGGFDFEFTWDKRFNIYTPRMGVQRSEFEFVYPGNVKNMKPSRDSSTIRNYGVIRGQGYSDALIYTTSEDTDSQSAYKRREGVYDYSDIPDVDTLQALGDEQIRILKDPLEVLAITIDGNQMPHIGDFVLGDSVKSRIENSQFYQHVNDYYRVDEITITIDEEDSESIELRVTK